MRAYPGRPTPDLVRAYYAVNAAIPTIDETRQPTLGAHTAVQLVEAPSSGLTTVV